MYVCSLVHTVFLLIRFSDVPLLSDVHRCCLLNKLTGEQWMCVSLLGPFSHLPAFCLILCVVFNTHTAFLRYVFTTPKQSEYDRREVTIVLRFGGVLNLVRRIKIGYFFSSFTSLYYHRLFEFFD